MMQKISVRGVDSDAKREDALRAIRECGVIVESSKIDKDKGLLVVWVSGSKSSVQTTKAHYTLPDLDYDYSELEPHIFGVLNSR